MPVTSRLDAQAPLWLEEVNMPDMARRGEALYQRYQCRSCHEYGANPKRLEGLADRLGYGAVIDTLAAPKSPMPLFPLSESQRRELAVFLLTRDTP